MGYKELWFTMKEHIEEHAEDLKKLLDDRLVHEDSIQYAKGSLDVCKMVLAMMAASEIIAED